MVLSMKYASASVWQEVCKKVKGAAVFIDEPSCECLSWHGGLDLLLSAGAKNVRKFSSFESGDDVDKAVFIVSSPLTGPPRIVLRDLISNSSFQHCILVTSCSPTVLTLATTGNVSDHTEEMTALHKLEADMLHWMKNKEYVVEIFHLLISCLPISDNLFTIPQFSHVMPCLPEDLVGKTPYASLPRNLDIEALPLELQVGIVHMMTTLNSLLSKLSVRESIYCMGMVSSLVGSQLQKHSSSAVRLKNAEHDASLLLIDRTLDLCGPLMLSPSVQNTLLDQIKATLPPLHEHSVDVAIDMSPLCYGTEKTQDFSPVAPGCFHEPPSDWIEFLIDRPPSEIIPHLYKRLAEALKIRDIPSRITAKTLHDLVMDNFTKNYELIKNNLSLVQAALGVVGSMDSDKVVALEVLESLQKMLFQSVAAENGTNEAMQQIIQVIYERRDRGLSVDAIFSILVFMYSLVGPQFPVDPDMEKGLKAAVLEMLTEEVLKPETSSKLVQRAKEDGNVESFCERVFFRLGAVRNARNHNQKYVNLTQIRPDCPLEYEGVISQILYDIGDVKRPEIPDLKYKANIGLRNDFTSRLAMMLNSSKPHVMDNDVIVLFVIGGITGHEVKHINNFFRLCGKRVIIGATSLLSPSQILDNLFLHDPLRPFSLVTGSNKGIGLAIVKNLCTQFKGVVYLTARDVGRGEAAVQKLKEEGLNPVFHQLDVLDQTSINKFAVHIKETHGGIDVLVNNAAIAFKNDAPEPFGEQAEVTIKTNYFALKNVCNALYPLLRSHARVVTVSSSAGHLSRIPGTEIRKKFADPNLTEEALDRLMNDFIRVAKDGSFSSAGWPGSTYVVSKVGASALTRIHHQKFLKDPREDIVINHVHPGYVDTDMTSHKGPLTPAQGADAPTYLALLPKNCKSPKGDYVWYTRQIVDWVNGPTPEI